MILLSPVAALFTVCLIFRPRQGATRHHTCYQFTCNSIFDRTPSGSQSKSLSSLEPSVGKMVAHSFFSLAVLLLPLTANGFMVGGTLPGASASRVVLQATSQPVELFIAMPPSDSGLQANMRIQPILSVPSEIIEVRYKVPFGLDVAPKNQLCVCTKDGPGGEKVGDVLRYTSQWTLGLPAGDGLVSTAASFSGGVSWQCSMFNVLKAKSWEQVVEALTTNVQVSTILAFSY